MDKMAHSTQLPVKIETVDRASSLVESTERSQPGIIKRLAAPLIEQIRHRWHGLVRPKRDRLARGKLYVGWFGGIQFYRQEQQP
jgi:hypothetical protein